MTTMTSTPVRVTQYSRPAVFAIWAAAALPMALLSWGVAPRLGGGHFATTLIVALTAGLAWQFLLVLGLVGYEQRSLRWSVLRPALWLGPPTARDGRRGGRLWLWAAALLLAVGAVEFAGLGPAPPAGRDLGAFLGSAAGHATLAGNWGLFAVVVAMCLFNTVLGEELLFRGVLLPRMRGAFGRGDWIANGLLFGVYHLHQPWSIPNAIAGGLLIAFATRRWRCAWFGIIAHSAQSVLIIALTLGVVLSA